MECNSVELHNSAASELHPVAIPITSKFSGLKIGCSDAPVKVVCNLEHVLSPPCSENEESNHLLKKHQHSDQLHLHLCLLALFGNSRLAFRLGFNSRLWTGVVSDSSVASCCFHCHTPAGPSCCHCSSSCHLQKQEKTLKFKPKCCKSCASIDSMQLIHKTVYKCIT